MGPLKDVKVVELVGLGPGPFCGMLLADLGATVIRVDRVEAAAVSPPTPSTNPMNRGKSSITLDLKQPKGVEALLRLVAQADVFFEVFRPGVAERLGIGPEVCLDRNPALVYGRLTGWGQDGPYAHAAGHDIDYLAIAGALEPLGRAGQPPTPPINVLADFAGGGMLLAFGIVAALFGGRGQVVDAAMVDGAALMLAPFYSARFTGAWGPRGTNHLDSGAPFYDSYETADGGWMAVGAIEPQFYAELLGRLGLDGDQTMSEQWDRTKWPDQKQILAATFKQRTRAEWSDLLEYSDACAAPALTPVEAPEHPHNVARRAFVTINGVPQPAPAPRFSRTSPALPDPPTHSGADTDPAMAAWGFSADEVADLKEANATNP
jgi:alpha-methylacyl-CoA racemase